MSEGIDPTLGAILPLVGVALGALLGGIARNALDRQAERRAEAVPPMWLYIIVLKRTVAGVSSATQSRMPRPTRSRRPNRQQRRLSTDRFQRLRRRRCNTR